MTQKEPVIKREHQLYVTTAKFLFLHQEYGVVTVRDPIKLDDAKKYKLKPLILYGLTIAGLPIRWMSFAPPSQPKSIKSFLHEAWTHAKRLRGQPDSLKISRALAASCPTLAADMAKIGVELKIADASEKSLPAAMRAAQKACISISFVTGKNSARKADPIKQICAEANEYNQLFYSLDDHDNAIRQWLSMPAKPTTITPDDKPDWRPGKWMSSWEASVPPDRPRYFQTNDREGTWLLLGTPEPDEQAIDCEEPTFKSYDNLPEVVKSIMACWPNPATAIASAAGITTRQLRWFSEEKAELTQSERYRLQHILSIDLNEQYFQYEPTGPYVLIAHKPKALDLAYHEISHGGDASPYEVVPLDGAADPSWRYFNMNPCYGPPVFVMVPRGDTITGEIPKILFNFDGIKKYPRKLYQDMVATCGRACQNPEANKREMTSFAHRNPDLDDDPSPF